MIHLSKTFSCSFLEESDPIYCHLEVRQKDLGLAGSSKMVGASLLWSCSCPLATEALRETTLHSVRVFQGRFEGIQSLRMD